MQHDVFISYSSKDIATAHRVYEGLVSRGVRCWIASRDIPAGGNYQVEIVNALRSAWVMVLVFSGNANASGEIEKELALASQHKLTIMPLRIDDVVPSGAFIYNLATSQWVEIFPDLEKNLDHVATTIRAITERIDGFSLIVRQALEDDEIGPTEQTYLEEEGVRSGLSIDQTRIIIRDVVGRSVRTNMQDLESEYLQVIADVLADGRISNIEKKLLFNRAQSFGIGNARAQLLLEQEISKLGVPDPFGASPISSTSLDGNNAKAAEIQLATETKLVIHDGTHTSASDQNNSRVIQLDGDTSWPNIGYSFLKRVNKMLDVARLPFVPLAIDDDEIIDEFGQTAWRLNDKHYISVWIDFKSRRNGKVTVCWGIYSENRVKDPTFRNACKEVICMQGSDAASGGNSFISLNGFNYEFVSDGYLGLETFERCTFEELLKETYAQKIVDQLLVFSSRIWPVFQKIES